MELVELQTLAAQRISDLVDQLVHHQSNGNEVMMAVVNSEIRDLTSALDYEEDFFFAPFMEEYK